MVTGVDYSRRSIEYATGFAQQHHLDIHYRYQDYLTLQDSGEYDVAMLIYGDFCPLSLEQRSQLLQNVYRALKPGGYFILDVTTRAHRKRYGSSNGWYVSDKGFWKPNRHLVLEQGYDYNELSIFLDQTVVTVPLNFLLVGAATLYREIWFFPAAMIVIGSHYLPFITLYGMKMFGLLAALLVLAGFTLGVYGPSIFSLGGWLTGILLIIFAFAGRQTVLNEEKNAKQTQE